MSAAGPGRVVYVGSIPYDQTEEQVLDIFRSVGPVANFRLVFDKDTGKSKGFGFVEYHDTETAASAVRNLNNYQIGPRNLRVAFSHETSIGPNVFTSKGRESSSNNVVLPTLPAGTSLPAGRSASEAITQTLNNFDQERMLQIITDLKSVINNNPALAIELFKTSPQLAYAAVQSLLILRMVDSNVLKDIIEQSGQPQQQQQSQPQPSQPLQMDPNNSQAALIQQVMQLSEQQIQELPAEQRNAIAALREKIRTGELQI